MLLALKALVDATLSSQNLVNDTWGMVEVESVAHSFAHVRWGQRQLEHELYGDNELFLYGIFYGLLHHCVSLRLLMREPSKISSFVWNYYRPLLPNNFQKDSVDTAADAQGWILHGTKCVILPTQKKKTRRADGGRLERHERIRFVLRSTAATSGSTMSIASTTASDHR